VGGLMQTSDHNHALDIMSWPGVIRVGDVDTKSAQQAVLALFERTLKSLVGVRLQEGKALQAFMQQRLDKTLTEVAKVKKHYPSVLANQRARILARFEEMKVELDKDRLEQEMVLLAQKLDVAEELDRLEVHAAETHRVLKKGGVVGRRLDFLMQEFNRETNTLASKSIDTQASLAAVELKVLIEQMREQVQNIE